MTSAQSTSAEREAAGKAAARREAPRSGHAKWEPAADRPDPVAVLEEESAARVPELVPIRYGRMLASPFTFFRGAAAIMAADLARSPRSGIVAQLCGDAHLSNFGVFAAPDRRLVFDLNDFDETHEGPWEWDVKRLAASIEIGGRDRGFTPRQRRTAVLAAVRRYREAIARFAAMRNLDVWYARMDFDDVLDEAERSVSVKGARRAAAKARKKDSSRALARLTEMVDGRHRIISAPPLIERVDDLLPEVDARLEEHAGFARHLCRQPPGRPAPARLVVPLRRHGPQGGRRGERRHAGVDHPARGAGRCRSPRAAGQGGRGVGARGARRRGSTYANHGERVVRGQRLMQAASDILLGWSHTTGIDGRPRDFYVRQLWDGKGPADVTTMSPERLARALEELCGWALARAHARSGDRIAIAAYLGSGDAFDRALADFAELYAEQNDADYSALEQAVSDGRLSAEAN